YSAKMARQNAIWGPISTGSGKSAARLTRSSAKSSARPLPAATTIARMEAITTVSKRMSFPGPSPRPWASSRRRCYQSRRKRVKPRGCFAVALAVALGAGAGCRDAPVPPGAFVVALASEPQSLDPRFGTDANSARLADLLHAGLTRPDAAAQRVPELAASWEFVDSTTVVFHLRSQFHFSDGRPVTAQDVQATYAAVLDPALASPKRMALAMISRIEAPDPTTVVVRLRAPFAPFLDATGLGILPAERARDAGEVTIGAGPFRLVSAIPGDKLVLAPNPGYADAPSHLDPLIVRIVPDEVVRSLELHRGTVQLTED